MFRKIISAFTIIFIVLSCKENKSEQQLFYPNGKLKSSFHVDSKGRKHGLHKEYYSNGLLKEKHKFKNGILTDTSFFFEKSGKLSTLSIFANGEKEQLKDIFYYDNGKVKEERTFFVGTGKINAFVSYAPNGKLKYAHRESKLVEIHEIGNSKFRFKLIGEPEKIDSITVYFFETANEKSEPYRGDRSFKKDDILVSVKDSDYINDTLNAIIAVYNLKNDYPNLETFQIQLVKNIKVPKNNLTPIYGSQRGR